MKKVLLLLIISSLNQFSFSQHYCGTPDYIKTLSKNNKGIENAFNKTYQDALNNIKRTSRRRGRKVTNKEFIIPVVFHVLYRTSKENLDDSIILNQLNILNNNFQRKNADTINLRDEFLPVAGNPHIKFVLADKDPSGNVTNGIIRTRTSKISFGNFDIKAADVNIKQTKNGGHDSWDTEKYLNIWVCNISISGLDLLLGYAFPPVNAKYWPTNTYLENQKNEGVVIHYKSCGSNNSNSATLPVGKRTGKTLVHEVGHYLGLRHIWADGNCSIDDGIEDTPTAASRSSTCNKNKNTCIDNNNEHNDMVENFMDYSPGDCQNTFTKKQVALMQYNLINLRTKLSELEYETLVTDNKIYPIPANNKLHISLKNEKNAEYLIKITDIYGRIVHKKILANTGTQTLSTANFPNGIYIILITEHKLEQDVMEVLSEKIAIAH